MGRLNITALPLPGLCLVERQRIGDSRGFLARLFCATELARVGWTGPIAQINHTHTRRRGTVRGLHFQYAPHTEAKLVCCLRGEVWDVAVDLRRGSPSFLSWHAQLLSADNGHAMLIPPGFAHGFQTMAENSELLYVHSASHAPGSEGNVNALDPRLAIHWPLPIAERSLRDQDQPPLATNFEGIIA